jgi:NitT/TauT family transport system substrate-binding protein
MIPALMALDGGYFDQQGLDVEMPYIAGSQNGVASMVSGEVQVLETAASAVVSANASGAKLKMIAGFVNRPVFIALTTPAISDPSQIKGTTWVVTGIGTSDYFGLLSMLDHFGLKPTDVTIVAANNTPGQIAAVKSGAAQGLLVSPPNDVQAQQEAGVKPFFDTSTLGVDEQNAGLAVTDAYGQANKDVVERFVAACAQGIKRFKDDKPFAEQVMKKYLKYENQQVLDSGWDHFQSVFESVPYPTDAGTQRIIDQVAGQVAAAKSLKPSDVIDRSYVQALEQRGFFASLGAAR